jgi:hypothetical protein
MYGEWQTTPQEYVVAIRRYQTEIGGLRWCAPQDWMCEPVMLARTGLTVADHQERTLTNYLILRGMASELPIIPVLQGWSVADYLRHVEAYTRAGVDLWSEAVIGLGTVCRRQGMIEGSQIVYRLAGEGLRLHGFGVKTLGLRDFGPHLASADSMAWSFTARRQPVRLPGHTHLTCANCLPWALEWREGVLASIPREWQMIMAEGNRDPVVY